jgi:hypothetical protein
MGNWFTDLFDIDKINAKTEQANKTLGDITTTIDNANTTIKTAKQTVNSMNLKTDQANKKLEEQKTGSGLLDLMLYGENDETAHFYKPDNKRLLLIIILSLLIVIVLILIYYADDFIKYHENKSDNIYL